MPPSVSWPLGYNRECDREHMTPVNIAHGLLLAPMLGSQRVLGWVEFFVLPQYSSKNFGQQDIGASCIPKMLLVEG